MRYVWVTLSAADLLRSPKIYSWQREQTTLDFWQASFTLDGSDENDVCTPTAECEMKVHCGLLTRLIAGLSLPVSWLFFNPACLHA